ncbi:MAG: DNA translocase FtsK 4TM domain-containing protein [Fuerstiella sp.]
MFDYERFRNDVMALGLMALVVFIGLSFMSYDPADPPSDLVFPARRTPINICGTTGASIAFYGRHLLGIGVWIAMAAVIAWDLLLFSRTKGQRFWLTTAGTLLLVMFFCAATQLVAPSFNAGSAYGSGGVVGAWMGIYLTSSFSSVGVFILVACGLLSGWMLSPLWNVTSPGLKVAGLPVAMSTGMMSLFRSRNGEVSVKSKPTDSKIADSSQSEDAEGEESAPKELVVNQPAPPTLSIKTPVVPKPKSAMDLVDQDEYEDDDLSLEPVAGMPADNRQIKINAPAALRIQNEQQIETRRQYHLPDMDLLEEPEDFPFDELAEKARIAATTLEKTFQQFGLKITVSEVDTGPTVTQFELDLEPGLRLNKVMALEDDLAIALRVPSVRVVAPIPGKNTVGVEVPNDKQVTVRLKELIQASGANVDKFKLPMFFGKDVQGQPLAVDLAKMPHLLIAGRTGTGKSVCLNSLIMSLLMTRTPDDVKMLMIDPKMVELSPYKTLPHLMHPVITDMKKAEAVLSWAVDKMEERYNLLSQVGVRHLDGYNSLGRRAVLEKMGITELHEEAKSVPEKMPYIVIIADEMADMIMTIGKDVEMYIARLAQKARAVGIHLILATQKPTVDVVTSLIKSNLPARVAFQVSCKTDSRVVLDEGGAERLLGCGDMLYLAPGTSSLTRAQGTFVSDDEMNDVIDFFSDVEPEYSDELEQAVARSAESAEGEKGDSGPRQNDDLYDDACDVVIREGRGSCSLLQRCLGIGYGRASRMIDWMAEDGIVGQHNGANARDVNYSVDEWEAEKENRRLESH